MVMTKISLELFLKYIRKNKIKNILSHTNQFQHQCEQTCLFTET